MAVISFLLAILLGGTAFLFKQAASQVSAGTTWAGEVCSASQTFCHHPEYLAYAGFGLMTVAIATRIGELSR
jgi:hypothetical protein